MSDCIVKFDGDDYVPVRAIPAVTADRFDPLAVTKLLAGDSVHVFARSYEIQGPKLRELEPQAWVIQKKRQLVLQEQNAPGDEKIKALPAGMVVPLRDLEFAFFNGFVEPQLYPPGLDESLLNDPRFLKGLITYPIMDAVMYALVMEAVPATVTDNGNAMRAEGEKPKPWLIPNSTDPKAEQPWYTPARYFARQLIKDDPSLLSKRELLAAKVAQQLQSVGICKRGGKLRFSPGTVLKAFSNVKLG